MNTGFTEYFGFNEDPFKRTPDIDFYFKSAQHQEALYTLNYLIESDEGFALLTGHPGTGKSITIRRFIHDLPSKVVFAYILFPNLRPEEMFQAVLEDFGIPTNDNVSKNALFSRLQEFLLAMKKEGKEVLIIVDEAQNLPMETLEELRILSNLETDKEKLLKIALVGQPELNAMLDTNELRQLKQRITLSSSLENLSLAECKDYILYRMEKAGRAIQVSNQLVKNVWSYTYGNPRLINITMQRAVIAAYIDNSTKLKKAHFDSAIKSLNMLFKKHSDGKKRRQLGIIVSIVLILVVIAALGYYSFIANSQKSRNIINTPETFSNLSAVEPNTLETSTLQTNSAGGNITEEVGISVVENQNTATQEPESAEENVPLENEVFGKALVNVHSLNVRQNPSLEAPIVGSITMGVLVEITEEVPMWVKIKQDDGREGWVYKRHLQLL